ncbi:hypothetical protein [Nocardioides sp.]|uniref:hypothetical protein n=1 Tax=Nocardioides sp. TaxID=35761 RepID=UPI00321A5C6C
MRATRLLVALLAFALVGLLPAATASSASASGPERAAAGASPMAAPVAARSARKLTAKIVKRQGGKLFLTGVIRPKKGPVVIQRATNCNAERGTCNFKKFGKSKVTKKGRYTKRVYAPRKGSWAWRAKKKGTLSEVWITCVKKPGDRCPLP